MSLELADSISIGITEQNTNISVSVSPTNIEITPDSQSINIVTQPNITNIEIAQGGIQGSPGQQGNSGPPGTGEFNLSGYITTGDADNRYYPLNSNPSGYLTSVSSNGITTGQADLRYLSTGASGSFYSSNNPQQYIRSGDVSSLYYTKNNESGFLNSLSGLSTGYVQNISGVLSDRLINTGSNLLSQINTIINGTGNFISNSQTGQFYPYSNPLSFSSSGNVQITGSNLSDKVNSLSGYSDNNFYLKSNLAQFVNSGNLYITGSINSTYQEVWIAPRTDNIQGNGTPYNPYDGSTSGKLDTLLRGFTGYSGTINFLPGKYYMSHCYPTSFNSGYSMGDWTVRGAGIDKTIITATGYLSVGNGRYILFASDSQKNFIEFSDLTLDGGTRTEGAVVGLINANSSNTIVRRVKFVNFGARLAGTECFPVSITPRFNQTTRLSNAIVEDCIFTSPWTGINNDGITCVLITPDNQAASSTSFSTARNTDRSSIIRGCYVDLGTGIHMSGQGYSHGYTAPVIENNFARNVQKAIYYDTHHEKDIVIRNNTLLDCNYGIDFNFGGNSFKKDTVIIEDNFIELLSTGKYNSSLNDPNYIGIRLFGAAGINPPYSFNHVALLNNRISVFSGYLDNTISYQGINVTGVHNLIIRDNVISDSFGTKIITPQNSNVVSWNNYTTGIILLSSVNSPYYLATNPNQYATSGNLYNSGNLLNNRINGLSGELQNTGTNLQNQINSIVGGTGNFYLNSNPAQFTTSGNLLLTGQSLYNIIVGLSGNLDLTGQNLSNRIDILNSIEFITGQGTVNYIPKFTSETGITNSRIIDSGNRIYLGNSLSVDNSGVLYFNENSGSPGNILVKNTGNNSTEYLSFISPKRVMLRDDFIGGTNADGQRGELGWRNTTIGTGTPSYSQGFSSNPNDADHFGIINVATQAASGCGGMMWLSYQNASSFSSLYSRDWDSYFVFKISTTGSIGFRAGFGDGSSYEPNRGFWLRYDKTGTYNDTGFMCVVRNAAVNTTSPMGILADTNWHTLRMWKYANSGYVNFSLDGSNPPVQVIHNDNNGARLALFNLVTYSGASVTASFDYFGFEGFTNR